MDLNWLRGESEKAQELLASILGFQNLLQNSTLAISSLKSDAVPTDDKQAFALMKWSDSCKFCAKGESFEVQVRRSWMMRRVGAEIKELGLGGKFKVLETDVEESKVFAEVEIVSVESFDKVLLRVLLAEDDPFLKSNIQEFFNRGS